MATEETALTSVTPALTPAGEGASTPASTLAGDQGGLGQVAQTALDQATTGQTAPADVDPVAQALAALPADDADLQSIPAGQHLQALTGMRGQLRALSGAYRQLEPLKVYEQYGDPKVVQSRLKLAELLYTPVRDRSGNYVRDPNTQTIRVTTKPFVEHIDKVSPGLPEQLLVDLLALETENEQGTVEPLINQVFSFYRLDFNRLGEYQTIDSRAVRSSGAVTPEELAEIPSEYHAAYRTIPASIRAAWASLDPADQTRTLEDYKGKLDAVEREQRATQREQQREAAERAQYAAHVATKQEEYLATVRRERTDSLINSLSQQITFSTDAVTNKVMIGTLAASLAQLFDPAWRFTVTEQVLEPLGIKLDHTFDEALARFDDNARESVALELAGNDVRDTREIAVSAANQLMAKIGIFALAIARKQGATVVEKAANQAQRLAAATAARPNAGIGQVAGTNGSLLPPGMRPGTEEAAMFLARQSGLIRDVAS